MIIMMHRVTMKLTSATILQQLVHRFDTKISAGLTGKGLAKITSGNKDEIKRMKM